MESDLYTKAAEILRKAREKRAILKTLIYASNYQNIRQLFALVNECSKHWDVINEVLSHCSDPSIVTEMAGGSSDLAHVLLYEYLLGHKFGRNVFMRKMIQNYKKDISSAVEKVLLKRKVKTLSQAAEQFGEKTLIQIPRYMRVNLIKSSVEDVIEGLVSEGWIYIGKINIEEFTEKVKSLDKWQFGLDPLLYDLLVFPIGTDLHDHPLTSSGVLVQQDRASCVPAHVLHPTQGSVIVDCCAAPGNKTSHLASLVNNKGRVIALDRDSKRMKTMSRLLEKSNATCVEMIVQDFLTVQPDSDDAKDIHFILVDPSCSGSGMIGSKMEKLDLDTDSQRLQTLKRFQILILKHALCFPAIERVVYSTCSVHQEENEEVVEEVMSQVSEHFQFCPVLPKWTGSRGLDGFPHSAYFLRLSPEQDLTQGFFVVCFERMKHRQELSQESFQQDKVCIGKIMDNSSGRLKVKCKGEVNLNSSKELREKCNSTSDIKKNTSCAEDIHCQNSDNTRKKKQKTKLKYPELQTLSDMPNNGNICNEQTQMKDRLLSEESCDPSNLKHSGKKRKRKQKIKLMDRELVISSKKSNDDILSEHQIQTNNRSVSQRSPSSKHYSQCDGKEKCQKLLECSRQTNPKSKKLKCLPDIDVLTYDLLTVRSRKKPKKRTPQES